MVLTLYQLIPFSMCAAGAICYRTNHPPLMQPGREVIRPLVVQGVEAVGIADHVVVQLSEKGSFKNQLT